MNLDNQDIVFKCRKCGHLIFLIKQDDVFKMRLKLDSLMKDECPDCGEEGYENWILFRMGNYLEEYGEEDYYPA